MVHDRSRAAAFDDFVSHELGALLSRHTQLDLSAHVLGWFRDAVRDVPAYARFLAERGVPWVSSVVLSPNVEYGGTKPTFDQEQALHHRAHEECFISQSVKTAISVEPVTRA